MTAHSLPVIQGSRLEELNDVVQLACSTSHVRARNERKALVVCASQRKVWFMGTPPSTASLVKQLPWNERGRDSCMTPLTMEAAKVIALLGHRLSAYGQDIGKAHRSGIQTMDTEYPASKHGQSRSLSQIAQAAA